MDIIELNQLPEYAEYNRSSAFAEHSKHKILRKINSFNIFEQIECSDISASKTNSSFSEFYSLFNSDYSYTDSLTGKTDDPRFDSSPIEYESIFDIKNKSIGGDDNELDSLGITHVLPNLNQYNANINMNIANLAGCGINDDRESSQPKMFEFDNDLRIFNFESF